MSLTGATVRWIALPFAVLVAFFLAAFAIGLIAEYLHRWADPFVGFAAAFSVVAVAYWCAPRHRIVSAGAALVLGSIVAVYLLRYEQYPENYAHPYEPTVWPLISTLSGGVAALAAVWLHQRRR